METGSRTTREQRSGVRDDNTSTEGQWDNPMSTGGQGKWEQREDNTGGRGGDTYASGRSGHEYGSNRDTIGGGGQTQAGLGLGGTDTQSDRYTTSGQYGGSERATTGQTAESDYVNPSSRILAGRGSGLGGGRRSEDDDEYGAAIGPGGPTGKPSMTSRAKGAAEELKGKIMGDQGKQGRGREREEGNF